MQIHLKKKEEYSLKEYPSFKLKAIYVKTDFKPCFYFMKHIADYQ